jgi:translation initiation factor 2B subunit (eIF-2B alpha/beta/delta family)/8-oxo-dGTP pyrophosphatase MutT (NUDIX family)
VRQFQHTSERKSTLLVPHQTLTYLRHHLGPISGSIDLSDSTPLAAAWREIAEETTLTPASLVLLRQGKSYTFRDESVRREWTVFPFLFQLKTPEAEQQIRTDWEHEAWGWHDPDAVIRDAAGTLRGVPRLAESLRRVWVETDLGPAASKALADGLDALARDHESGARQLAGAALQTLRDVVAQMDATDDGPAMEEWWAKVRFAAWHLWKNGRESMGAAILSALLAGLAMIEQRMRQRGQGSLREDALRELDARIAARHQSAKLVSEAFAAYLEKTFALKLASHQRISILTLSESSTIRQGLRRAAESGFVLDLRILESRPLYEGVSLAGALAEELLTASSPPGSPRHKVTLLTDASAALASSNIDVLVLGADRIASSGAVSNKTGSLPAALSAKHVCPTAKIVVLGESDKIAPPGRPEDHVVEDNDPTQLSRAWLAEYNSVRVRNVAPAIQAARDSSMSGSIVEMEIRNVFFEWVPASLIDGYVMETGEWTIEQIAEHSAKLEAEEKRLFGRL